MVTGHGEPSPAATDCEQAIQTGFAVNESTQRFVVDNRPR